MTYLIIGGLGFVGYNLAKELLKYNNKVISIDNLSNDCNYYFDSNITKKIKKSHILDNVNYSFYKLDIVYDNLDIVFNQEIDYVIFLADMSHDYYSILKSDYTKLNTGLKNVLFYVKKKKIKFILGSSSAVYDKVNKKILNENENIIENATDYSKAIKINEDIVLNSNIPSLILRIAIPYGDGLLPNNFLYEIIFDLYSNKRLLGYEYDALIPKDFICINDLIHYIILSFKYLNKIKGCEIINIGSGISTDINTLLNNIVHHINYSLRKYNIEMEKYDFKLLKSDFQKLNTKKAVNLLKYKSKIDLNEILYLSPLLNYYEKINIVNQRLTPSLKKRIDKLELKNIKKFSLKYIPGFLTNKEVFDYLEYRKSKLKYILNEEMIIELKKLNKEELLIRKEDIIERDLSIKKNPKQTNYLYTPKIYDTHEDRITVINYINYLLENKNVKDCIFCKIIKKEINSYIIYEDNKVLVFFDNDSNFNKDILITPKEHFIDYFSLPDDLICYLNIICKRIYDLIKERLKCLKITLSANIEYIKNSKHVYIRLIPEFSDEIINKTKEEIIKLLK